MSKDKLDKIFDIQKKFNSLFYDNDSLSDGEKEEVTKSFCLALHAELSDLVSSLNYKEHREERKQINREKILYESIDVIRYTLAILNLWDFTPDDFESAFVDKDLYLNSRQSQSSKQWEGQPVVIVDLDDVVISFRRGFIGWLRDKYDIRVSYENKEYYTSQAVKDAGLNPESVFFEFIKDKGFRRLEPISDMISVINDLKRRGYWIQLLTARPDNNLQCLYDTYRWVENSNLEYDRLDFSGEKYRWCANSEYFDTGSIVCAIDDSPKHSAEYSKHHIPVIVPCEPYNQEVRDMHNVYMIDDAKEVLPIIEKISL
jgi:hypothetical protein